MANGFGEVFTARAYNRVNALTCRVWDDSPILTPSGSTRRKYTNKNRTRKETGARMGKQTAIRYTVIYDPEGLMPAGRWLPSQQFEFTVKAEIDGIRALDRGQRLGDCLMAERGRYDQEPELVLVKNGEIVSIDGRYLGPICKNQSH